MNASSATNMKEPKSARYSILRRYLSVQLIPRKHVGGLSHRWRTVAYGCNRPKKGTGMMELGSGLVFQRSMRGTAMTELKVALF